MFGIGEGVASNSLVYDTVHLESQQERRQRYAGFWLMCTRVSCAYIAMALTIPSTWPYLHHLQPSADKTTAAWIISGMFVARIANNALLGVVLKFFNLRSLALLTSIMVMVSYLLWSSAEFFPDWAVPILALSRAIDGLFGTDTVIGSLYVTRGTTQKERGAAMALLAGAATAAYVPGAGMASLLSLIGSDGVVVLGLRLNMYTTGGLTAFLVFFATTIVLYFHFYDNQIAYREHELGLTNDGVLKVKRTANSANYTGIAICILSMCGVGCVLLFNDSLLVPMFMDMNGWFDHQAVRTYGFIMIGFSIVSTLMFLITAKISNRFGEDRLLLIGIILGLLGFAVALPWGSKTPPLASSNDTTVTPGCPASQSWCKTVPRVEMGQYIVEVLIHGVAVALLASTSNSLFSRCLPKATEGFWWGLMKALANISRLTTPVAFAYLYRFRGPRLMYGVLVGAFVLFLTITAIGFRRLSTTTGKKSQDEETPLITEKQTVGERRRVQSGALPSYGSSESNDYDCSISSSDQDEQDPK